MANSLVRSFNVRTSKEGLSVNETVDELVIQVKVSCRDVIGEMSEFGVLVMSHYK